MNSDIRKRLFTRVLYAGMLISISAICVNLSTGFPLQTNIKWVILFLITLTFLLLNRKLPYSEKIPFILFLGIILFFMPYAFINSGGGKGDFLAYAFFTLISLGYITSRTYQRILFLALVAVFVCMHIVEYLYPELIPVYDYKSRFYDRLIQVPILFCISYMIIKSFTEAYNESNDRLYYYANYDMLTGLLNRWGFSELLAKGFDSVYRDGILLLIDIDNFKLINDHEGHKAGDEALKRFGEILKDYFSDGKTLLSRWGGDEFIVLFSGSEEKLNSLMEEVTRDFQDYISKIEPLANISLGSVYIKDCRSVDDLLVLADQFMYRHKNEKRKICERG